MLFSHSVSSASIIKVCRVHICGGDACRGNACRFVFSPSVKAIPEQCIGSASSRRRTPMQSLRLLQSGSSIFTESRSSERLLRTMRSIPCFLALALALGSASTSAQSSRPSSRHSSHVTPPKQFPIGGSAPSGARLKTPADLSSRIARWPTVEMPFRSRGLTPRQIKMIGKLVEAARLIDSIYWRQSDPYALTLAAQLKGSRAPRDRQILRYLSINGGQYDLLDGRRSFINGEPAPAGRALYPGGANPDATRQGIESFVQTHPESRAELFSPTTLVRPMGADLVGLPYRTAFRAQLLEAARELRDAAALALAQSNDAPFAEFLRARADALL